ncbi:hypothetical protein B7Y94_04350 [Candidatus Saccharibacteria bacterium 32-49-12]|nr:MAG: hypothetical protein B7Y94_04350 [Candidatus Saccharibacteria bacterium 32-49-12]
MKQKSIKVIIGKFQVWLSQPVVRRSLLYAGVGSLAAFVATIGILISIPDRLSMGFQPKTCLDRSAYAWGVHAEKSNGMVVELEGGKICVRPDAAVVPGKYRASMPIFGLPFLRHPLEITVPNLPQASLVGQLDRVPLSKPLEVELSQPDSLHTYRLGVAEQRSDCKLASRGLSCEIEPLGLRQGEAYEVFIERLFKGKSQSKVLKQKIEVLDPVRLTESSIQTDEMVFNRPSELILKFDKPLAQYEMLLVVKKGEESTEIVPEITLQEANTYRLSFGAELIPREATVELVAKSVEASDGSTVEGPLLMQFRTSGGPRVTGVNVGPSGVAVGAPIVVTFDQDLSQQQPLESLIEVGGGVALQSRRGNQLIFSTSDASKCGVISINLRPDFQNPYGISGRSAWRYSGRMSCYTTSIIGYSSQGRAIYAYHFGDGGPSVVYTGAIHGNEVSTKYLMDRWIQELNASPGKIPANKRIIVVPTINPDGLARGSRINSRNVDLNRNFNTSNWQKDVQHVTGQPFPGGGGEAAMSEPETKAIASLIAEQRPELVLSYHSVANLVISNGVGQANARAAQYAGFSGYRLSSGDGSEFGYTITGTADSYYGEKLGVPSLVIELGSHTYHQFERNQAAMWAMVQS